MPNVGSVVSVTETLSTALTGVATQMTGVITTILPIALGIVGSVMVVTFGVKLFKKISSKG